MARVPKDSWSGYISKCRNWFWRRQRRKPAPVKPSARFCRVLVLVSSRELDKWVRSPPAPNRAQRVRQLWGKTYRKMSGFSRYFFYHKRSLFSGQLCPTLSVNCLADTRYLGGVRSWMSDKPSQLYIHTTMTLNLGTSVSPSYRKVIQVPYES